MHEERRCIIISGSPEIQWIATDSQDYLIACDMGIDHVLKAEKKPDIMVGDFDSYDKKLPEKIPVIRAPKEKDDTDTMMAARYAIQEGYNQIILLGALGGRLDHTIANLQTAAFITEHTGHCVLYGRNETIYLIKDSMVTIPRGENHWISCFSWSEMTTGINYKGLKYPLQDAVLDFTFAKGVSNEFAEEEAVISVKEGILLIIVSE